VAAPAALERAGDDIRASLEALGYPVTEQWFADGESDYRNLIATRRGSRLPEQRLLVVAHYDTVANSPGADDNASGVAVLLELAELFKAVACERTLQFVAVNLEERAGDGDPGSLSLRGSRALAAKARAEGWQIDGVVVLESVAYAGAEVVQTAPAGVPVAIPPVGDFIAVVGNQASAGLVEGFVASAARHGLPLPCLPLVVPGNGELLPDTRRSDHAPFWDQGYPAIMLTDTTNFRSPHYHQPSDTLETLNLEFAAAVCRATAAFVAELVGAETA